jgi:hypothetical protein
MTLPSREPYVARRAAIVDVGGLRLGDLSQVHARLKMKKDEGVIVTSKGHFSETVQPWEKLLFVIEVPEGYQPTVYTHQVVPEEVKDGRVLLKDIVFTAAPSIFFAKPDLAGLSQKTP